MQFNGIENPDQIWWITFMNICYSCQVVFASEVFKKFSQLFLSFSIKYSFENVKKSLLFVQHCGKKRCACLHNFIWPITNEAFGGVLFFLQIIHWFYYFLVWYCNFVAMKYLSTMVQWKCTSLSSTLKTITVQKAHLGSLVVQHWSTDQSVLWVV